MGRIMQKLRKEQEPKSKKLFRELEEFYRKNPNGSKMVKNEVDKIRRACDITMKKLQEDFDQQHEETTCVYMQQELDFLKTLPTTHL